MVGFVVAVAPHWKAGENGALLWCVALALWVGCLGVILRKLPFSFKDQQSGSPLVHALAGSSYHGSSVINGYQLRKQVFHQHFTLLPFQGILHVLDCPPQSCHTHPETFSRWNFWLFIFAWNLWRPISWFGVATQTCLGGMCPTVGTGLAHRVSGLWHVLRLAGPQQLLHLLDEQDFPDSGWKAQDKACQC